MSEGTFSDVASHTMTVLALRIMHLDREAYKQKKKKQKKTQQTL